MSFGQDLGLAATELTLGGEPDRIYMGPDAPHPFAFDRRVARVFDDMISRSVPFYREVTAMTVDWVERFYQPETNVYDIGCSTGTTIDALARRLSVRQRAGRFVGIDDSEAMLERAESKLRPWLAEHEVILRHEDATDAGIANASAVILNYTLQFVPVAKRLQLLSRIHQGLVPGGILFLSEKVIAPDERLTEMLTATYERFKSVQGYSRTEIERKREALDQVLVPLPFQELMDLLGEAGFAIRQPVFHWCNFTSIVALKE